MARISTQAHGVLLALACIEALVLYGFARDNPPETLTNEPKNASIPDCLAPSGDGDFVDIAPDYCEVVTSIDKECSSFLFPANSSAPSIIEGICDIIGRKKVAHHLRQNEA